MELTIVAHNLFSPKRLRRSPRFEPCIEDKWYYTVGNGLLGYFEYLPLELKFTVFDYLSVVDISLLSITSKSMRDIIELYRDSKRGQSHILSQPFLHSDATNDDYYLEQFQKLGLLWKRSTCLYSTKDRLKKVFDFMTQYLCLYNKECINPLNCLALNCMGKFLHIFLAGWDDRECARAFEVLAGSSRFIKQLQVVTACKHGSYPLIELNIRLFFRRVFLSTTNKREFAFWLNLILRPFPMVHQAKILFLLFGPLSTDGKHILWYEMCDTTPFSVEQAYSVFGDLSSAFHMLHYYCPDWNEDDIVSVVDELSSCPDGWLSDNIAHLLFMCGDTIAVKVLNSKAINGRISELSCIIVSLCLVCIRHIQSVKWVMNIIRSIFTILSSECSQKQLVDAITDMFRDLLLDLHNFGDTDDERQDMLLIVEAQSQFFKEIYGLHALVK